MASEQPGASKPPQKLTLRVKSKKSQNAVLRDIDVKDSISSLLVKVAELAGIPSSDVVILSGFPPKRLEYNPSGLVESMGLQHQDTLIVEASPEGSQHNQGGNGGPQTAKPAVEPATDMNRDMNSGSLESSSSVVTSSPPVYQIDDHMGEQGMLLRQIVPSDNSCLFSSITFCLSGSGELQKDSEANSVFLRELIANTVAADPVKYNEAMLGRPNKDYVNWIRKIDSWGGGIELSILAEFYGIQISVVDIQSLNFSDFGEDQNYPQQMFLIYDGIHYDPLYFEPFAGGSLLTMFPVSSTKMKELAKQLAQEAKASNQFTDLKNFALRCQICNTLIKGEEEAQAHAKKTGHASFAEIQNRT